MEFYDVVWRCRLFNTYVSIPNGMEFYVCETTAGVPDRKFQFPTGWNSIPHSFLRIEYLYRFNSQWDGIILKQATINAGFAICFNSQGDRLPAQFILINKVLDLPRQIYLAEARNLPCRINSAEFYFTLFISISPPCAPISIRSPVLISSLRIISAILSSTRS